ncbi:MAG: 6-carboxytetrahydropterin synthase [Balneolales bacterium]|nr:6-carboxytetrahydropterin synthase [Balneolales bacterium]
MYNIIFEVLVYVTRKIHFNAAHRLHNPAKSDSWNAETYGKCNNANWHGHNYVMEVTVCGMPDKDTGYVIDLGVLKGILKEKITDKVDHKNLNIEVDFLEGINPSTENLVICFYRELEDEIKKHASKGSRLFSVKLFETERNFAEFRPESGS